MLDPSMITEAARKSHPRAISETKRQEVRFLILSGVPHKEVVHLSGVSSGTINGISQELRASTPIHRNTETDICVPNACPTRENGGDLGEELFQAFEERMVGPEGIYISCNIKALKWQTDQSEPIVAERLFGRVANHHIQCLLSSAGEGWAAVGLVDTFLS